MGLSLSSTVAFVCALFVSSLDTDWQHTGVDYVLGGSTATSEQKTIYAVGNGVVVFSTRSNKNPILQRGGLVIIKHVSPRYGYDLPRYEGNFTGDTETFTIKQPAFKTEAVYSYYLHLDPSQIMVAQGRQVTLGEAIGQTYSLKDYRSGRFTYPPSFSF